ncbi:hypothetical protein EMIHUDRAFT_99664 [Emiliania huxleyi CCMP1516]|uniref:Uncharacterized protein n=2 Tax=Emiliania huxleyi TaxID=2903 RepID=A0A0D3K0D7_EMIH1|nr:hypothetical protein EMIHUDRAFT_99664 [Emiliania huxleyi CCMP1516]EOD29222.1 hypothetical protein EMIHUDRAFT_99664 [Emiliania huxleyi CCMP1516]|eukprot:XP_005781651.1 hypothetical protein EMIHUDRAFT_99664 [Emiliania huxleyi CCMP1516]
MAERSVGQLGGERSLVSNKEFQSIAYGYPQRTAKNLLDESPLPPAPEAKVVVIRLVDANALALMAFGFSTLMFAAFLCDWKDLGDSNSDRYGFAYIPDMLTWGVSLSLTVSGIIQGLNDDLLGFSSYLFHAAMLGTIGYNFEENLLGNTTTRFDMIAWLCYAATWINLVFALMAVKIAALFGVLYLTVANMFFFVGLNFHGVFDHYGPQARQLTRDRYQ